MSTCNSNLYNPFTGATNILFEFSTSTIEPNVLSKIIFLSSIGLFFWMTAVPLLSVEIMNSKFVDRVSLGSRFLLPEH